jgi:hypothetical protein
MRSEMVTNNAGGVRSGGQFLAESSMPRGMPFAGKGSPQPRPPVRRAVRSRLRRRRRRVRGIISRGAGQASGFPFLKRPHVERVSHRAMSHAPIPARGSRRVCTNRDRARDRMPPEWDRSGPTRSRSRWQACSRCHACASSRCALASSGQPRRRASPSDRSVHHSSPCPPLARTAQSKSRVSISSVRPEPVEGHVAWPRASTSISTNGGKSGQDFKFGQVRRHQRVASRHQSFERRDHIHIRQRIDPLVATITGSKTIGTFEALSALSATASRRVS